MERAPQPPLERLPERGQEAVPQRSVERVLERAPQRPPQAPPQHHPEDTHDSQLIVIWRVTQKEPEIKLPQSAVKDNL